MKFLHFIPYVNRLDLLIKAINSVPKLQSKTILIDNSEDSQLVALRPNLAELQCVLRIEVPPVSLTTAQTYNMIAKIAIQENCDFYTFMHNDGEAGPGVDQALLDKVQELMTTNPKWGVVFTHYDVFCAYNTAAIKDTGWWDQLRFPFYFLDNDYFNRMTDRGWQQINTSLPVTHHTGASSTIKADPVRAYVNNLLFPVCERMYRDKWPNR